MLSVESNIGPSMTPSRYVVRLSIASHSVRISAIVLLYVVTFLRHLSSSPFFQPLLLFFLNSPEVVILVWCTFPAHYSIDTHQ